MSLVARKVFLAGVLVLGQMGLDASAKDLHVLVLGDRLAANCHTVRYPQVAGVVVLSGDGSERRAADPLPGADCNGGSVWMPLATNLKQQPGIDKLVLVPVAVDGAKAEDWNNDTEAARRLAAAVRAVRKRGARIDYALWQQGLADSATSLDAYMYHIGLAIRRMSLTLPIDKWLIATVADCGGRRLEHVRDAQRKLATHVVLKRFPGPHIDLPVDERTGECTLSAHGQEIMAQRWFDAIQRADLLSARYRTETLIRFFE